ncbi:MAG TPA: CCA tRNA nucleotidyltransferase, partial [Phycisphaerae bacterium]|nr:CCA tRNA nucleotidyltransferase [Phycisphaerae bacterium]
VIDYIGGKRDLAAGVVRTIGRADKRFSEDYLRMIRAVRFAVRLDFRIARDTAAAIRKLAPGIEKISGERIYDELTKMLSEPTAGEALDKLMQLHLAPHIFPGLFDSDDTWAPAVRRVEAVAKKRDTVLNFGALLCDVSTAAVRRIVRRWGASNEFKDAMVWLLEHRDDWRIAPEMRLCEFKRLMAGPHWSRGRELWKVREQIETTRCDQSRRIARRAGTIAPETISPPPLIIGEDLMKMGLTEGRKLGRILRTLYDAQLNEELKNRRKALAVAEKKIAAALDKNS